MDGYVCKQKIVRPSMESILRSMEYISRILLIGIVVVLFSFVLEASANDIPYRHYSIQDGLPHENISTIEQTPDGRMWVGTSAGLAFNTGRQFKAVRFLGAIGTVNVREIEPTSYNEVWVATNHQGIWKARFEHAKRPYEELANVHARRLIEKNDSLFVFSQRELWIVSLENDAITKIDYDYPERYNIANRDQSAKQRLMGVVGADIAPDGTKWLLDRTKGPGLLKEDGSIEFYQTPQGIEKNGWYSLEFDDKGIGWITNEKTGLYRFDPARGSLDLVIATPGVRHICITPMVIAVTSYDHGTLYWNHNTNMQAPTLNEESGFPTNRVNCIFRDKEKNVWVGTQIGLIHMSHPGVMHLDNISNTPLVNMIDVLKHSDSSIWAASQTEGIFQMLPESIMESSYMSHSTDFFRGKDGRLHILGEQGWYAYNKEQHWHVVEEFKGGIGGAVDKDGIGFFRHHTGLFRHEAEHEPTRLLSWNPQNQEFYRHALSSKGDLIVWRNGQLVQLSKTSLSQSQDELRVIRSTPKFIDHTVNDMIVDELGRTWVALLNDGMLCIEPDTAMHLLPGHQINRLSLEGDSLLIASANEGLFVFNFPKGEEAEQGIHLEKDASIRFHLTQADGLLSSIVAGATFSASTLWINHPGGVTRIPRALLEREPPVPQVLLTGINYNGIARPPNRPLSLSAVDRNIGFSFEAPSFTQPHRVHYRYRLRGLDDQWENTEEPGVQFTDLPAGDYTFEVQASASSLKYGMSALYNFQIPEPYYQRPYFWMIILMMTVALMYTLHRYRLRSILRVERTRTRIAMDLHDDIGSSLTSLSFLSNLAWQHTNRQKPKEEIAPLLQEISHMSSDLVDNMLDIVWSVDPKHDSVGSVIGRLQAFYQRMSDAADITMNWHVEDGVSNLALAPRSRRNLFLIMKEAINNAVKHSGTPVIDIRFDKEFGILQVEIHDYGKGFDVDQMFSGYGLNTMKERAHEEGGTLDITSIPNRETVVLLRWPIKTHV